MPVVKSSLSLAGRLGASFRVLMKRWPGRGQGLAPRPSSNVASLGQGKTCKMTEEIACISPRTMANHRRPLTASDGLIGDRGRIKKASSPFPILNARKPSSFTYFCCTHSFVSCCFIGSEENIYTLAAPDLTPSAGGKGGVGGVVESPTTTAISQISPYFANHP